MSSALNTEPDVLNSIFIILLITKILWYGYVWIEYDHQKIVEFTIIRSHRSSSDGLLSLFTV